jgi:3-hydroxyacyl-CoA dehydrogenase/enoyl-CoA hydratase/3-hydroxybutyryl-CoA epimerase
LIRGEETSDYAVALAVDFVKKIRKIPIVVNDSRGFYTSRCFSTYTTEGIALLKDGVDPVLIENAGKNAGMPVGALAVSDEVALDLALKISKQSIADGALSEEDGAFQVTRMMVEDLGRFGKKNKKGFYEYPEVGKKYLWEGLAEYFPVSKNQPEVDEVKKRLLYRQVVESIRCIDEGVLMTKLDGNIGSILAWGFPPYAGGTLNFAGFVGIETFLNEVERLANTYGERFRLTEKQKETLHKWFGRKGTPGKEGGWVDCNTCRDGKCKPCGRKEGEKRAKYPSCRPTPAQCKTKGKGKKWGKTK